MTNVLYRVKSACALYSRGDLLPAVLLFESEDSDCGLLWLVATDKECECLLMCSEYSVGVWEEISEDAFINLSTRDEHRLKEFVDG